MLKIETTGFLDLTPTTVHNFRIVCDWIGDAFATAEKMEQLEASRHFDRLPGMMPAGFFDRQRTVLEAMARHIGFNLSVAFIGLELLARAETEARISAECLFTTTAEKVLPAANLLFDYHREGWDYAILMPGRALKHADDVMQKLLGMLADELGAAGVRVRFRHSVQSIHNVLALVD